MLERSVGSVMREVILVPLIVPGSCRGCTAFWLFCFITSRFTLTEGASVSSNQTKIKMGLE